MSVRLTETAFQFSFCWIKLFQKVCGVGCKTLCKNKVKGNEPVLVEGREGGRKGRRKEGREEGRKVGE
jgi:hypothetical protein